MASLNRASRRQNKPGPTALLGIRDSHSAAYQRAYREMRPDYREHEKRRIRARSRALTRLSQKYPDVFQKLFDEEWKNA